MKQYRFVLTNFFWSLDVIPRAVLKKLLEFATKKTHFLFDGKYNDQIDSVAMGSPLVPVLANIFMCHFEERWVMNGNICPSLGFRYVDDTFTMFNNKDSANEFYSIKNSRHNRIKFTIEFEHDNEIPFLDIRVKRNQHAWHSSTAKRHSQVFILNGTLSFVANT